VRRAAAFAVLAAVLAAPPAVAAGPRVGMMVVGRSGVVFGPRTVRATATTVAVGAKRCAAPTATPLAALAAAHRAGAAGFSVRDYGSCSSRAGDSGSLFVFRIGADRNRGRNGWTYKVGVRSGTTGAADPTGAFGTGRRLRAGDRVTWFWCVLARSGSCQRTLAVLSASRRVAPGAPLAVTVRGYDDAGHGVAVRGATVRLGQTTATTAADGRATLTAPSRPGRVRLTATRPGMVRAFGEEVLVG
jgi:hypothetical protein